MLHPDSSRIPFPFRHCLPSLGPQSQGYVSGHQRAWFVSRLFTKSKSRARKPLMVTGGGEVEDSVATVHSRSDSTRTMNHFPQGQALGAIHAPAATEACVWGTIFLFVSW